MRFKTFPSTTVTLPESTKSGCKKVRPKIESVYFSLQNHTAPKKNPLPLLLLHSFQELSELPYESAMVEADPVGLLSSWRDPSILGGLRKIYRDMSLGPRLVHYVAVAQMPVNPFQAAFGRHKTETSEHPREKKKE